MAQGNNADLFNDRSMSRNGPPTIAGMFRDSVKNIASSPAPAPAPAPAAPAPAPAPAPAQGQFGDAVMAHWKRGMSPVVNAAQHFSPAPAAPTSVAAPVPNIAPGSLGSQSMASSADNIINANGPRNSLQAPYAANIPVAKQEMISAPGVTPPLRTLAGMDRPPVSMVDANTALPRNTYATQHGTFDISGSPRDLDTIHRMQAADTTSSPEAAAKRAESAAMADQRYADLHARQAADQQAQQPMQAQGMSRNVSSAPDYSEDIARAMADLQAPAPTGSFDRMVAHKKKVENAKNLLQLVGGMQTDANKTASQENMAGQANATDLYKADQAAKVDREKTGAYSAAQDAQNMITAQNYGMQRDMDAQKQQLAVEQANAVNEREAQRIAIENQNLALNSARFGRESEVARAAELQKQGMYRATGDLAAAQDMTPEQVAAARAGLDPRYVGIPQSKPI